MTTLYTVLNMNLPVAEDRGRVVKDECGLRREDGACVYGKPCIYPNSEEDKKNCHLARQARAFMAYVDYLAGKR